MQSVQMLGQVCHFVPPAEVLRGVTVAENHLFRCWTQPRLSLFLALLPTAIHITQCQADGAIKPALFFTEIYQNNIAPERAIIEWNTMIIFQINLKASPTTYHSRNDTERSRFSGRVWVCSPERITLSVLICSLFLTLFNWPCWLFLSVHIHHNNTRNTVFSPAWLKDPFYLFILKKTTKTTTTTPVISEGKLSAEFHFSTYFSQENSNFLRHVLAKSILVYDFDLKYLNNLNIFLFKTYFNT